MYYDDGPYEERSSKQGGTGPWRIYGQTGKMYGKEKLNQK